MVINSIRFYFDSPNTLRLFPHACVLASRPCNRRNCEARFAVVRLCRLLGLYEAITVALIRVGAPVWQDCFIFVRSGCRRREE